MARNTYPLVQETSTLSADGDRGCALWCGCPTRYTVVAV